MSDIKNRTIALFEKHRAAPGVAFDPEHFLDFLLKSPPTKRAVYNSFSGLRRLNAFMDALQLECAVCFSQNDREANYSLDKIVARIEQLQRSPRGSLASLSNQLKGGPDVNFVLIVNLVLLVALAFLRARGFGAAAIVMIVVAFNCWYAYFHFKARRYQRELHQRLLTTHGIDKPTHD
ncbi:MAG TPA: hypothetical protein VMK82_01165 [Steroidobacteraceae bacterium]|nr:hypothetical protein [Steroidobacteraceae bacterium]